MYVMLLKGNEFAMGSYSSTTTAVSFSLMEAKDPSEHPGLLPTPPIESHQH